MVCGDQRFQRVDTVDGAYQAPGAHGAYGVFERHWVHGEYGAHGFLGSYVDNGVVWSMGPMGFKECTLMRDLGLVVFFLQLPFVSSGLSFCEM